MGRLLVSRVYLLEFNCSLVTPAELDDIKLVFGCSLSLAGVAMHSLSCGSLESSMVIGMIVVHSLQTILHQNPKVLQKSLVFYPHNPQQYDVFMIMIFMNWS